jgi:hypothetical protein
MDFDKIKEVGTFHGHLLPAGVAFLAAIFLVFLAFKAAQRFTKLLLFLTAIAFFAAGYWWFVRIRS